MTTNKYRYRLPHWVAILAIIALLLATSAVITSLQMVTGLIPRSAPFEYYVDRMEVIPYENCVGVPIKVRIVGKSFGRDESVVTVSHAFEKNGQTVYRPAMPNTLRFPSAALREDREFDFIFDTAEFYRQTIGEFPKLEPGVYDYRHEAQVIGYESQTFVLPFEVIECTNQTMKTE